MDYDIIWCMFALGVLLFDRWLTYEMRIPKNIEYIKSQSTELQGSDKK